MVAAKLIRAGVPALAAAFMLAIGGCGAVTFTIGGSSQKPLETTVVQSADSWWTCDRVAIVDVSGMLMDSTRRGLLSEGANPLSELHEKLERARADSRVKAIILRLNTPGGTVAASDAMYNEVLRFKRLSKKPVVVMMMSVTASGGYYLACAGDTLIAYPSTITGSIGVILQTVSLQPGLSRIGITTEAITSGPNKDAGSPFTAMTESHRAVFRRLVDDFYANFTQIVRKARPNIPPDRFAEATDGRIFSGHDALKIGLVDELGDIYSAFEKAKKMAGISDAALVKFNRPSEYVASPYAVAPAAPLSADRTQINLMQVNLADGLADTSAGFYYLWRPTP
jgi:protease IV